MLDLFLFFFLMFALNKFIVRLLLEFIIPSQIFNSFSQKMYETIKLRSLSSSIIYINSTNHITSILLK